VKRIRGGLVFKAHRLLYHSTLGLRVIKKKYTSSISESATSAYCSGVDVSLPGQGNANSHGARPVHLIITMIMWIRTSSLSIKNSLSGHLIGSLGPLERGWGRGTRARTSYLSRIKSPFSDPSFALALAGIRRLVVQIKAIGKYFCSPCDGWG